MSYRPTFIIEDADGLEHPVPHRWVICTTCQGEGVSSAYLGAFTHEQMQDEGPEFLEEYLSGGLDRACDTCNGRGSVKEPVPDKLPTALRVRYYQQERELQRSYAIERNEQLMGA